MGCLAYGILSASASQRRGILVLAAFHVLNSLYQLGWLIYTLLPAGKSAFIGPCVDAALPDDSTLPIDNSTVPAGNNTIVPDTSDSSDCELIYNKLIVVDLVTLALFILATIASIIFAVNFKPPVIADEQAYTDEEYAMQEREIETLPAYIPKEISPPDYGEFSALSLTGVAGVAEEGAGDSGPRSAIVQVDPAPANPFDGDYLSHYAGHEDSHVSELEDITNLANATTAQQGDRQNGTQDE
jgi:hypothetical protein